jgi:hypothetical protein
MSRTLHIALLVATLPSCAIDTWGDLVAARTAYEQCLEENHGDEEACRDELEASNEAYDAYEQDAAEDEDCEFNDEGCGAHGPAVDEYGRAK